ncbi:hypothetical protein ZIOFF_005719 [Zingiber officinale]|uniref:Uncharacterized protein n=1 Tax=Zingiber officinale TaxID=94328 RepID=A0A8J5LRU6_ZINOF|nr:hypothetical protein ZIOFF_005719 [Zingiber officinale]
MGLGFPSLLIVDLRIRRIFCTLLHGFDRVVRHLLETRVESSREMLALWCSLVQQVPLLPAASLIRTEELIPVGCSVLLCVPVSTVTPFPKLDRGKV